jgi:hypothetical protein
MKKYFDLRNIIILFLLLIITIVLLNPGDMLPNRTVDVLVTDSIPYPAYDTLYEEVEVPVPFEVPVEVIVEVPTQQFIDTMEILKIFYVKNLISTELILPNNQGTSTLEQLISENKIINTEFKSIITPITNIDTIFTPENKKNQLYFGVVTGMTQKDHISNIGMGLLYKTKDDKIFKLTGGVANRLETEVNGKFYPYLEGGVFWKIRIKKD